MTAPESVIAALENLLSDNPANHEVRMHLAGLLLDNGELKRAQPHVQEVLARLPADPQALTLALRIAHARNDTTAVAQYETLLRAVQGPSAEETANAPHVSGSAAVRDPAALDEVPDTADDLLEAWESTVAPDEPEIGEFRSPGIKLSDVAGLTDVKARLERSLFGPMRNPELAAQFGSSLRGGLLLYGPPGCGKTFLARAIASELGAKFYSVALNDILDMWLGNSERNLHQIFEVARAHTPCVLFLDEVDALGLRRGQLGSNSALRGVVNQFLTELDGVDARNDGMFVIAASNHPWDIDEALVRPGRLGRLVFVGPPDVEARQQILRNGLESRPSEAVDYALLASKSAGLSGADLMAVCEFAADQAFGASLKSGTVTRITTHDMLQSLRTTKTSIGAWVETAANVATYANSDGRYDDFVEWLKSRR